MLFIYFFFIFIRRYEHKKKNEIDVFILFFLYSNLVWGWKGGLGENNFLPMWPHIYT